MVDGVGGVGVVVGAAAFNRVNAGEASGAWFVDAGAHFDVAEARGVFGAALVLAEPSVVVGGLVGVDDRVEVDGAGGGEGLRVYPQTVETSVERILLC